MRFQKKVERVDHRHLGDEIDFDAKFARSLGKDQAREVVRLGILLPVDEMLGRFNSQRIAQNAGATVRRGSQSDNLRSEVDQPIVTVVGNVVQRDVDRHGWMSGPEFTLE